MTKKEMVNDLAEVMLGKVEFEEAETVEQIYDELEDDGFVYITVENLLEIKSKVRNLQEKVRYSYLIKECEKEGLLKVRPEVWSEYPPMFTFKRNAHLSWFRGYRFQVSGDHRGNGDYGSSQTTLGRDLRFAKYLPEHLKSSMAFSHVCEATNSYSEFWSLVEDQEELLNKFMNRTDTQEGIESKDFNLSDVWGLISSMKELPSDGKISKRISLTQPDSKRHEKGLFATLVLADKYIALKYINVEEWLVIDFPSYNETSDRLKEYFEINEYYEILWERLVWLLVTKANMVFNFMYAYPRDPRGVTVVSNDSFGIGSQDEVKFCVVGSSNQYFSMVEKALKEGFEGGELKTQVKVNYDDYPQMYPYEGTVNVGDVIHLKFSNGPEFFVKATSSKMGIVDTVFLQYDRVECANKGSLEQTCLNNIWYMYQYYVYAVFSDGTFGFFKMEANEGRDSIILEEVRVDVTIEDKPEQEDGLNSMGSF